MDIFARATKEKLRFQFTTPSGAKTPVVYISTEDLWELSLNELDVIAIELDAAVRNSPLKSFVNDNKQATAASDEVKLKLEIVVYIIEFKKSEKDRVAKEKELRQRKELAKAALTAKTESSFSNMTEEELRAIINE